MATVEQVQVAPKADDFVFIERKEQSLEELQEELVKLRDEVALLHAGARRREKFQEKFFELFIAFTVLVTPIAAAFAFNQLTDDHAWGENCQKSAVIDYLECLKSSNSNLAELAGGLVDEAECEGAGEERTLFHLRQAIVFVLIAVSTFVGVPYYYYMMDDMCRTVDPDDLDEDEASSEADPDETNESKKVPEGGEGEGDVAEESPRPPNQESCCCSQID